MKMITAIINRKDANLVCDALTNAGFIFTKIATSGGFLKKGNVTLLIGTDTDRVKEVIGIIRDHSAQRTEKTPSVAASGLSGYSSMYRSKSAFAFLLMRSSYDSRAFACFFIFHSSAQSEFCRFLLSQFLEEIQDAR